MIDAAAAWFRAVSHGRLEFRAETVPRWLSLPAPSAVYAANGARYLEDAVAAADPYVDFSQIDVVYLAPALRTPHPTPVSAVLNSFGVRADGREIGFWVPLDAGFTAFPDNDVPGLLLHETAHLLGLPDLYLRGVPASFHRWDLMTGPGRWPMELLAWHRWKLRWLDPGQVVCVTGPTRRVVTLAPLEHAGGTKAIFVRRGRRTLAAEVRARFGYDHSLCETGVLVYEVDQTPFRRGPVRIRPAQSDGLTRSACGPQWNAPFDIGRREIRTFRLPAWRLRLELVAKLEDGSYRVHIVLGQARSTTRDP
jgi:M6 family metalloprotease-like protein